MDEVTLGEVRLFAGTYAPVNWAFCDGSLLPIPQNSELFMVLGTRFGGDGTTSFALPKLDPLPTASPGGGPIRYIICTQGYFPQPPPS